METVENVTQNIPSPMPAQEPTLKEEESAPIETETAEAESERKQAAPSAPTWEDIVSTGVSFIQKLGQALSGGSPASTNPETAVSSPIAEDEQTGEKYIKLPLPQPEILQKFSESFGALLEIMQKWAGK